ncbi:MAG: type IX secretion system sortase PorU [Bacteroidales bacterium]
MKKNLCFYFILGILPLFCFAKNNKQKSLLYGEATSSVLSSGRWIKLKIKKTGVYKLSRQQLRQWGFNNLTQVSIWGNGCEELPRLNSVENIDDLRQIPTVQTDDGILFYAEAKNTWKQDTQKQFFFHIQNEFSDISYVYMASHLKPKVVSKIEQATSRATYSTNTYDYRDYRERIDTSLLRSGRRFFDNVFDAVRERNYSFSIPFIDRSNSRLKAQICVASQSQNNSSVDFTFNDRSPLSLVIKATPSGHYMYADTLFAKNISVTSENITINMKYNRPTPSAWAVLDFITINARAELRLDRVQLPFRDAQTVGVSAITEFRIITTRKNIRVWNVTHLHAPQEVMGIPSSGNLNITLPTSRLSEFIAFTEDMAMTPEFESEVKNQNLHGSTPSKLVIISHPAFLSQAERIASFHRLHDKMSVQTVTTEQVYNEFSGGIPDVSAIRNFMRMFYRRNPSTAPQYLLLFGSGSYVNFSAKKGVGHIPTYQSNISLSSDNSYTSDDYFGVLNDSAYLSDFGMIGKIDLAVGRLPVYNSLQANTLASKIENYYSDINSDWISHCIFIADDEDANVHVSQSEVFGNYLLDSFPSYFVKKIYLDAYQQTSSPMGKRYPDATEDIASAIGSGAFLVNYVGHANDQWLSHEQVVTTSDINKWNNRNKLPLFITATCEFSRFDDPARLSAGEQVLFSTRGGAIAMLSTTRLVYSNGNAALNKMFIEALFSQNKNGQAQRLGDAVRFTKNNTQTGVNQLNFSLLGDPALKLLLPTTTLSLSSINGVPMPKGDTLKALDKSSIIGSTKNSTHDTLIISIYDKEHKKSTLGNSGQTPFIYREQNSLLYRGKVSTLDGVLATNFIVPKDIEPRYGWGKINITGKSQNTILASSTKVIIGGASSNPIVDTSPPQIRMYMNSEQWVNGGITNESPTFVATLNDSSGINVSGSGIGRSIILTLQPSNKNYILNNYYTANVNNYTSGRIEFPLPPLDKGNYTATLKVWDIANNTAEQSINFVVADEEKLTINKLLNYPNPFTQTTVFFFEHNRPYTNMEILIQIFTVSGKLVRTIHQHLANTSELRSPPIEWNGLDDYGDKLGRGTYLYKVKVRCCNGENAEKVEKLVKLM